MPKSSSGTEPRRDQEMRRRGVPAACVTLVASNVYGAPLDYATAVAQLRLINLESALTSLEGQNMGSG